MSKSDDHHAQILDERFEDILARVKPYLLNYAASSDTRFCRLWLERFNRADDQRSLRNEYLLELYRQLKNGYLKSPFNKPPEIGKLMSLAKLNRTVTSSSCNELTETSPSACEESRCCSKTRSKSVRRDSIRRSRTFPRQLETHSSSPREDVASSPLVHFREQSNNRCEKTLLRTYKNRIETLSTIVEELENQNEKLRQKLGYYQNISSSDEIPHLHSRIKQLMLEISSLKNKLTEVHELKAVLEDHHKEIVDQYKIKMTEQFKKMKHQLENARSENRELNDKITLIDQKIKEMSREKEDSLKSNENLWMHKFERTKMEYEKMLHEKEKQIQSRDEMVHQKEMELTQKLDEIDYLCEQIKELQQLVEIRSQDDGKLQCILVEQHKNIMSELSKMRNNIEVASRQQSESHQQEIALLKKNVQKFEKFANKLQEEYGKNLYHIIKEQDKEINNLQKRMRNVYNDPFKMLLSEKYFKNVTFFEKNCKRLINSLKTMADNQCNKYFQKLSSLEDQINRLENR